MKFKGVIFDLDGTLVDSLEDLTDAMNSVLKENAFPVHDISVYRQLTGSGIKELVKSALPEGRRDEVTTAKCLKMMMDEYREHCTGKTKPYPGIFGLLDELVRRGIKLSVLSNKTEEFTKKIIATLFPSWEFEFVVGLGDESYRKPDPRLALRICRGLGLSPEDVLYVGDSGIDMQTANRAGMYAVGVLWGFRSAEEMASDGAKLLLRRPLDLIEVVSR